jgi:hypothetical protein
VEEERGKQGVAGLGNYGLLNLKVWDMAGKLVAEQTEAIEGQIWESKPMELSNGIYLVEVNGQRQRWVIAQ